jgi:hypothetical protein
MKKDSQPAAGSASDKIPATFNNAAFLQRSPARAHATR